MTPSSLRLDALVKVRNTISWSQARTWIETGKVFIDGTPVTDPAFPVKQETEIEIRMNAPRPGKRREPEKAVAAVYEDAHLIVVDKPSGLSSVPFENEVPDSLQTRIEKERKISLRVVQRLDRETSGLLVFAKTPEAERGLAQQFRFHQVERRYLAVAHGRPRQQTIKTTLVTDRGDGLRGSLRPGVRAPKEHQKDAVTHLKCLASFNDCSLIVCRLETGRTHQIRIHLSEAGHPLVGERLYVRDYRSELVVAPRILLHARSLGFEHPTYENRFLHWESPLPLDFQEFLRTRISNEDLKQALVTKF